MKKLLLIAAVAVFGFTNVNAQEENTGGFSEGDIYVSGSVGFNTTSFDDADSNEFTFSPEVGFFITENISLEAGLIIGSAEDFDEDKFSSFGGALGANYFFTPQNQFSFIVGAGVSYLNTKVEPNGGEESKVNTFAVAVAPGVSYFVSNNFAIRASLGALSYSSSKPDFDGAEATNDFGLNIDLSSIDFGVTYKF